MKTNRFIIVFLMFIGGNKIALAQDTIVDPAIIEKAWKTYMMPGTMHKLLASSNGEWTEEVSVWKNPAEPAVISKASCVNTMILGGRYQQSIHKGEMDGMPFEGMSIWGWNNASNTFESTWIDNMGTGIMFGEGRWDEKTKTATFRGRMIDPVTKNPLMIREVFRFIDNDSQTLEMFTVKNGKENRTMAIKYSRVKK